LPEATKWKLVPVANADSYSRSAIRESVLADFEQIQEFSNLFWMELVRLAPEGVVSA